MTGTEGSRALRKDEIQRQVDAVRAQRSELENHIIDEYRSGYIGRREFIRRGTVVGMSLPLVGFLASACGSGEKDVRLRSGRRGEQGRGDRRAARSRSGLADPGSDLDPIKVNNQGALATLSQSGEFLIYSDRRAQAPCRGWPRAGSRTRDGIAVDVQDPPGREVPRRQADDGGGRRGDVQPARRSRQRLQRALGVHRRAVQGRRPGDRRHDGDVRARRPERRLPVHGLLGQLQPDHPAQGLRPRRPGRRRSRARARGSWRSTRPTWA